MAKEKTIKRIGVVLVPRNIIDTDSSGKPLRENTMWFGLNNEDYFFSTGVTVYEASTQKKTCSLSTNPELIKMISRSGVEHSFYVDDSLVEDIDAINTAIENIK